MSDTASLEVSRELFELSGWDGTYHVHYYKEDLTAFDASGWHVNSRMKVHQDYIPAYDAGYLLRKLPHEIVEKPVPTTYEHYSLRLGAETSGEWYANYWMFDSPLISLDDIEPYNTPEDALAKLAIELHKAGILPISGRD